MDTTTATAERGELLRNLVLFARALRRVGIGATLAQVRAVLAAVGHVGLEHRGDVRASARAVFVQRQEQIATFDRLFDLFWSTAALRPRARVDLGRIVRRGQQRERTVLALPSDDAAAAELPETDVTIVERRATYSATEVLRRKDFAELDDAELVVIRRLMRRHPWHLEPRRTRRRVIAPDGPYLDLRRTLRRGLATGGEALELARRRRREKPRPLVVLCDISGSMESYSRIFLQFLYTLKAATDRLEAFVFGTRLTRISRQLEHRDVDHALRQATAAVVDWGGGTRIGSSFKRFNYDWGRRVLGQGAVVAVLSDGWDRGDVELLERETARLRRSCDRLLWLNPLLGSPSYQPLTRGIRAVLPHVDDFLPVHNLESLEQLGDLLARAGRRRADQRPCYSPA